MEISSLRKVTVIEFQRHFTLNPFLFFSGITREQYFAALKGREVIKFVCKPCVVRIPPRDDGIEVSFFIHSFFLLLLLINCIC